VVAIEQAGAALAAGTIVAVKGVGGFHLACDATNDAAVRRLRAGKERGDKPFALMAASAKMVREYAELDADAERVLTGRERPIVLLRRRESGKAPPLSPAVAPGSTCLGFMLPYLPLHHLLHTDRPLVMTSGNAGGAPIVTANEDARTLAPPRTPSCCTTARSSCRATTRWCASLRAKCIRSAGHAGTPRSRCHFVTAARRCSRSAVS
jgi:hydrogenase maturation protein HypF